MQRKKLQTQPVCKLNSNDKVACSGPWCRAAGVKREHLIRKMILYIKIIVKDELDMRTRELSKEYGERGIKEMANNRVQRGGWEGGM